MTTKPVTERRIALAAERLSNAEVAAEVCREVGLPFYAACALLEQESGGRNVYGHDSGGALSGFEKPVTKGSWEVFRWLVIEKGGTSNGVGPCQITYAGSRRADGTRDGGFFRLMEAEGLKPWVVRDNMLFGFRLLWRYYLENGRSWVAAGTRYNGAESYGRDLEAKVRAWKDRLGIK